jgi:hypothetical protein
MKDRVGGLPPAGRLKFLIYEADNGAGGDTRTPVRCGLKVMSLPVAKSADEGVRTPFSTQYSALSTQHSALSSPHQPGEMLNPKTQSSSGRWSGFA